MSRRKVRIIYFILSRVRINLSIIIFLYTRRNTMRELQIRNRIALLKTRNKENNNIIRKLERQLRRMGASAE